MKNNIEALGLFLGTIAILLVLLGYPVMLLWNWLMPVLFGLSEITFWQAIGINILCTILFRPTINIKKPD
jgi:hypothetical protein